jgi:hypothetical protein
VEEAFFAFMDRVIAVRARHGIRSEIQQWKKDEHVARLESRGFRSTRELLVHHREDCTAVAFRETAARVFGDRALPWHVSYRVRVAVK